jgi:8-oxo-dGTP pyrophosphatase MutT (NUDIX family)
MDLDLARALADALDQDPRPELAAGDRLAAVLALIALEPEPNVVFTRRSSELSRHAGEIAFPGGLAEPGEELRDTALREAHEEIGLDPGAPRLLGALPPVHTHVSSILVIPFVGVVHALPALAPRDGEIDEVLVFPLERLLAVEREVEWVLGSTVWRGWVCEVDGSTIWGATGRMLHDLLEIVRRVRT